MKYFIDIILSLPKTILFNFLCFDFLSALKLPLWVHYRTHLKVNGKIKIKAPIHIAMIRYGFHTTHIGNSNDLSVLHIEKGGFLIFEGSAHIGRGSRIFVNKDAILTLGDNFAISASSQIACYKSITFGCDVQFSWDCLVMDSDTHTIYDVSNKMINENKQILFGNKIWIGCRVTILKGAVIPSNCVIGSCSLVSGNKFKENTIIVGSPAKSTKEIGGWHL